MHLTWKKSVWWETAFVFLGVLAVYLMSPMSTSFDSRWALATADSIFHSMDTDLVEFTDLIEQNEEYGIVRIAGRPYNRHPIGAALVALPFLAVLERFKALKIREKIAKGLGGGIERRIASFVVALTAAVLFANCRRESYGIVVALLTTVVFAFGTSAWSTASRALWQHGPSMLMIALGHYALVLARERPRAAALAGLPLAFAFIVRPTNAIVAAVFSLVVGRKHPRQLAIFLTLLALVLVPFAFYSLNVFGQLFPPYYSLNAQGMAVSNSYIEALVGQIVSPNRGILVFSPVLLFAIAGLVMQCREKRVGLVETGLIVSIVANPIVVAAAPMWWGGHSYGPRFFTDVLPFACFFLAPFLSAIPTWSLRSQWIVGLSFALLFAFSVFVHYRGSFEWSVYEWNTFPINIDEDSSRAWDFHDLQFFPCISKLQASRPGCL